MAIDSLDFNFTGLPPTPALLPDFQAQIAQGLRQPVTTAPVSNANGAPYDPSMWDKLFGWTNPETGVQNKGVVSPLLQGASSIGNLFLGMKQYGLADKMFAQSRREFDMNWQANKQLTNAQLADRQAARVASNPGAYQSVGDYLSTYGVR